MTTRKFLSKLIPALPMLLTAALVILVTVIFLTAMRSKAHAQFGGVEQPMFQNLVSVLDPIPQGYQIWLKPDTLSGTNSSRVTTWVDSSPFRHDATNANASGQPWLTNSVINGYPAVWFSGGSVKLYFETNNALSILNGATNAIIQFVSRYTGGGDANGTWFSYSGTNDSKLRLRIRGNSAADYYSTTYTTQPDDGTTVNTGLMKITTGNPAGEFRVYTWVCDWLGASVSVYTNSVLSQTKTSWGSGVPLDDTANSNWGVLVGESVSAGRMQLAQFLMYVNVTNITNVRSNIDWYSKDKFGL